jgi:hypothetical protein
VDGWPPNSDRSMPHYIRPDEDTFLMRPSKAHLQDCNMLVIIHSTVTAFEDRRGVRDTWIKYVTEGAVKNVSVIFLVGSQNGHQNMTEFTR